MKWYLDFIWHDIMINPFVNGHWLEIVGSILMWLAAICFAVIILAGFFHAIDNWFTERFVRTGKLVNKEHHEAHTTTTMVMAGKAVVPVVTRHPESWRLGFEIEDSHGWLAVAKAYYCIAEIGSHHKIMCNRGRITGSLNMIRLDGQND